MEVHQHTHTPRKKWTHYVWEFLMLFLAVFCGFLAENQREHYVEHKRAKEYAEMMKDDLLKDTAQLGGLIRGKESLLQAQKNWERFWQISIDKVTWTDIETRKNPGVDVSPFLWNDATYSQMKSSGNLRLFRDKELIKKIALYESLIKRFEFWNNWTQELIKSDHYFQSEVNEEVFRKNNPSFDKNKSLKMLGYNFEEWSEASIIGNKLVAFQLGLREDYREVNKIAGEIISLLNKNYHLK